MNIVELVRKYTALEQQDEAYIGVCPFCKDSAKTLVVNSFQGKFHCFSCRKNGDAKAFMMYMEPASIEKTNIWPVLNLEDEELQPERILAINKEAALYFNQALHAKQGRAAREYLKKRKISLEISRQFGLGYADSRWDSLRIFLRKKGFTDQEIDASGLGWTSQKGNRGDNFRNRLMFPILDVKGRVVGFGGRVLDDSTPKYINTKETILFDKSRTLFGLYYAQNNLKNCPAILCEGNLDVVSLHQAGFRTAVAPLGTAFTHAHALRLKQYTNKVVLSFDNDKAGQKATWKAIQILKEYGFEISVLFMGQYKDPDEVLKNEGASSYSSKLQKAIPAWEFELQYLYKESSEKKEDNFLERSISLIEQMEDPAVRKKAFAMVAKIQNFKK